MKPYIILTMVLIVLFLCAVKASRRWPDSIPFVGWYAYLMTGSYIALYIFLNGDWS